ncbi:hypothetical protein D3C83_65600 [compost metagenome]
MAAVSSMPWMKRSAITTSSYRAASSQAGMIFSTEVTLVMPIEEPSRTGFTISGSPSRFARSAGSVRAVMSSQGGVGSPAACHRSLVRHLSIASALAITPLPV